MLRFGPDLCMHTGRHGNRPARSIDRGRAVCTAVLARNPTSAWLNFAQHADSRVSLEIASARQSEGSGTECRRKRIVDTSISADGCHIFIFRYDAIEIPVEEAAGERKGSHPSKVLTECTDQELSRLAKQF
jgi:hypothetical protein